MSDTNPECVTELRSDCTKCAGLCCTATAFSAGGDFAIDKEAHEPCPNLQKDFRCSIHGQLREKGFPGCVVFECYGAGQKVTQGTFGGRDWQAAPEIADQMFETFRTMRPLHELLMYLDEALKFEPARSLHDAIRALYQQVEYATLLPAESLLQVDVGALQQKVNQLLLEVGRKVRAAPSQQGDTP